MVLENLHFYHFFLEQKLFNKEKVDILNFDLSNKKQEAIFEKIAYMPQGLGKKSIYDSKCL